MAFTTYSYKSFTGSITNTSAGVVIPLVGGSIGSVSIHIRMATERTAQDVAADAAIMVSYIAGNNGMIDIECQQTSILHQELLSLYNSLVLSADQGDLTGWAATVLALRNPEFQHVCTGVSFLKKPDTPYQARGQNITWNLLAADIISL